MTQSTQQHTDAAIVVAPQVGNIDCLRKILAKQRCNEVTHEEANEIGAALIEFFEVLAAEEKDELD